MTTKQKEKALAYVLEKRGYLVQAFTGEIEIGTVIKQLNLTPSVHYRKQPFRVMAETTVDDFQVQNQMANELGMIGLKVNPRGLTQRDVKFYRLATD